MMRTFLVSLLLFLNSSCGDMLKSSGGNDYTVKEDAADVKRVRPTLTATYDESTDSLVFLARFELSGSSVDGETTPQTIRMTNESSIMIDSQAMTYNIEQTYLADDSRSDTVGCNYELKMTAPKDLSHVFVFDWTAKDGHHYRNSVVVALPIYLSVPAAVSTTEKSFNVGSAGPVLPSTELLSLDVDACNGNYPSLQFAPGQQTLSVMLSNYVAEKGCQISLASEHRSRNQAVEVPTAGGSVYGIYRAKPVVVRITE